MKEERRRDEKRGWSWRGEAMKSRDKSQLTVDYKRASQTWQKVSPHTGSGLASGIYSFGQAALVTDKLPSAIRIANDVDIRDLLSESPMSAFATVRHDYARVL
jgi:hypothetical protein